MTIVLSDSLIINSSPKSKPSFIYTFWLPIIILFIIGNIPIDHIKIVFEFIVNKFQFIFSRIPEEVSDFSFITRNVIAPCRALFFLASLLVLIFSNINIKAITSLIRDNIAKKLIKKYLIVFVMLSSLVSPLFLRNQGIKYGFLSTEPFSQNSGWYYRRILLPALSYFLNLNGLLLYFVLSLLATLLLIILVNAWLKRENVELSVFQLAALFSSGYIIFLFQFPGYVEVMVFIFLFIGLLTPHTAHGRGSLLALMLLTHETAAIVISLPIIFFVYPRKERILQLKVVLLYLTIFFLNFGFNIKNALGSQTIVDKMSSLDYLLKNPGFALAGICFAYKFLWLLFPIFFYLAYKNKDFRMLLPVSAIILFPFVQLPLGIDTSRLISFGYFGILTCFIYIYHNTKNKILINIALVINILIPSFYIGLNTGKMMHFGLYYALSRLIQ